MSFKAGLTLTEDYYRKWTEGAGKGGGGRPVREIGEVMLADGCRQSFAGVRVQALPFFQRHVIRQREGKKFAPLFRTLFNKLILEMWLSVAFLKRKRPRRILGLQISVAGA